VPEGDEVSPLEARYLAVKNWDKFQHYKQRNPPWIRLHRTLLRDHKFNLLTEVEQWMLVRMWLLASETDNHMAYDEKWVRRAINSTRKVPLDKFVEMGFLEEVGERSARAQEEVGKSSASAPKKGAHSSSDDSASSSRSSTDPASTALAARKRSAAPEAEERREERTSIATPVEKDREDEIAAALAYMDSIDFHGRPRLEALGLGPRFMEEAIRRTRSRGDVDNPAAYFTTVTRNLLAAQRAWKSEMPLEDRLATYVRNAGHEYPDDVLADELERKGADELMVARLLVFANELRGVAA
jgi:hypothetical protein